MEITCWVFRSTFQYTAAMMEETKKAEWGEGKTHKKGEWKVGLVGREWLQEKRVRGIWDPFFLSVFVLLSVFANSTQNLDTSGKMNLQFISFTFIGLTWKYGCGNIFLVNARCRRVYWQHHSWASAPEMYRQTGWGSQREQDSKHYASKHCVSGLASSFLPWVPALTSF